jgi:hypothetical protein
VITWLERLAAALLARDPDEIHRLLGETGGRTLPPAVRREAIAIAREGVAGRRTPIQTLHHLHRTRQLHDGLPHSPGTVATPPSASADHRSRNERRPVAEAAGRA